MSRQYPRFLFSDPQNTKSTGPFIVHTLNPRFICRVSIATPEDKIQILPGGSKEYYETRKLPDIPKVCNGLYTLTLLDLEGDYREILKIMSQMLVWYYSQIREDFIAPL